jgi:hypothetical protein
MKKYKPILGLVFVTVGFSCVAVTQDTVKLPLKFKDINAKDAKETFVLGLNNANTVVGRWATPTESHGMILTAKGKLTFVDHTNGSNTRCVAINLMGDAVCLFTESSTYDGAFLWHKGKIIDLQPPGSFTTFPAGINDKGVVVGGYEDVENSVNVQHGFLWDGKKYKKLDVPFSAAPADSWATSINNNGNVSMSYVTLGGNLHGAIYDGKKYTKTDVPFKGDSELAAINNTGDLLFVYTNPAGTDYGVLRHGGKYFKFSDPKATNSGTDASKLNDHGALVGYYWATDGRQPGFIATY